MMADSDSILEKCRNSAKKLTPEDVLKKCAEAAEQRGAGRVRTIHHSKKKSNSPAFGGRSLKWSDFQSALRTSIEASWQEEHGTWKLSGGVDRDGDPVTVAIAVSAEDEDIYVWTGF